MVVAPSCSPFPCPCPLLCPCPSLQPEDITYLTEVHKDIMQHHGLTSKHFELYCKHFEATLADPRISTVIPKEKKDEAVKNIKSCAVIFKKK